MRAALDASRGFRLSYWDAAILETARLLGCRTVLSEDLIHGRGNGAVTVKNPFRTTLPKRSR